MTRRPPPRQAGRDVPVAGSRELKGLARATEPAAGVADVSAAAPSGAPAAVGSRSDLVELLGDLRRQGGLDLADEAAILREYDDLLAELRTEKTRLETEFRDRLERDGQEDSHAWLAERAGDLGRRQGERMRRLLGTIPGLDPQARTG